MSIKVLFVGMTPNPGGIETYIINIFSYLQNHGFQFDFVNTYKNPIAYENYIRQNGGQIYESPIRSHGIIRYLTRFHIAKKFIKSHHNYDIIHINALSVNSIYWAKAAKKYDIKHIIIQSHNAGVFHDSKLISFFSHIMSFYNKLYLRLHPNITKLAASNTCGKWMFNSNRFTVINNGIDTKYFYPNLRYREILRRKLNLTPKNKVILTTARIDTQKNYPKIINVFKEIHNIDSLARLVIIGSGPKYSYIKNMVHSMNLDKYVYFLGMQKKSNVSKLLNIGDLMLMPSYFEAIPFSLTEAQSVGLPAVVSNKIPRNANITRRVMYLSLNMSDKFWAKKAMKMLNNSYNYKERIFMNNAVKESNYNLDNSIKNIKSIYIKLMDK